FWEQLLARAKEKGVMYHAQRAAWKEMWVGAGIGVKAGISLNYVAWMKEQTAVELSIFTEDKDENKRIFDKLHTMKGQIEQAFGAELAWDRKDEDRGSRVRFVIREGGLVDQAKWLTIQEAMIDAMSRLAKAFNPHLAAAAASA